MGLSDSARARIQSLLPEGSFSDAPDDLAAFGRDWTRVNTPAPSAVVFPRSTPQVSQLLALCNELGIAVVPSGGRTGLAGGAVAARGEVVLSLSKMTKMYDVDTVGGTLRVEAGAVTEAVHAHAAASAMTWPVDFASKGSSTIGGNIATNAGGVKVIRYGLTRQWVLGLDVVLANGDVLRGPGALEKNNTGLDLRQMFIGTEGTLGVITEATLKLTKLPGATTVLLFGVPDVSAVLQLFQAAKAAPFTVSAYEFFSDRCLDRVVRHRALRPGLSERCAYYVLIEAEAEGREEEDASRLMQKLQAWLERVFAECTIVDGTLAQHPGEAKSLWALRESISESLSATGLPHKNDVSLPIAALESFCAELEGLFRARYPNWEICLFGHVGDGNLHINVLKPESMGRDEFFAKTKDADRDLFALVQRHGGSISAEHGIGLLKKPFLSFTRTEAELRLMRAIKGVLDPNGILNPGKIFDL